MAVQPAGPGESREGPLERMASAVVEAGLPTGSPVKPDVRLSPIRHTAESLLGHTLDREVGHRQAGPPEEVERIDAEIVVEAGVQDRREADGELLLPLDASPGFRSSRHTDINDHLIGFGANDLVFRSPVPGMERDEGRLFVEGLRLDDHGGSHAEELPSWGITLEPGVLTRRPPDS